MNRMVSLPLFAVALTVACQPPPDRPALRSVALPLSGSVVSQLGPCDGCDLSQEDCIGNLGEGIRADYGLQCVPKRQSCDKGDFRQCHDSQGNCDYWMQCESNAGNTGSWTNECNEMPPPEDQALQPNPEAPFFRFAADALNEFGRHSLTCRTGGATTGGADLQVIFADDYPQVSGDEVSVEGRVCNEGGSKAGKSTVRGSIPRTDVEAEDKSIGELGTNDSDKCERFSLSLSIGGLEDGAYDLLVEADYDGVVDEGANEGNNSEQAQFIVGEGGESTPLRVKTPKLELNSDKTEVEISVEVCIDADNPPAEETRAGIYLDQQDRPACGDEPDESWTVGKADEADDCRKKTFTKAVPQEIDRLTVWAVADVDCDLLKERDAYRAKDYTLRLREGADPEESSGCGMSGSTPVLGGLFVLLLYWLVLLRAHRRD
jgi:hypothetical protein